MTEALDPDRLDALWDFDDPTLSESRFRSELATAGTGTVALELITQLARSVGLRGRFEEAAALLDSIDATTAAPVVVVRVALERGRILNSAGRAADAVPYFVDALTAAESAGEDFLAIDAAHMLGIADQARSMSWNRRALAMIDTAGDERSRRWKGSLHNNIGWTLHDDGDHRSALDEFELALAACTESGAPEQIQVAHWAIARCLRSLGRTDEALAIQDRLHADGPSDGYVEEELGELLLAVDPDRARLHFAEAARLLGADEWVAAHEPEHLARLRELGGLA